MINLSLDVELIREYQHPLVNPWIRCLFPIEIKPCASTNFSFFDTLLKIRFLRICISFWKMKSISYYIIVIVVRLWYRKHFLCHEIYAWQYLSLEWSFFIYHYSLLFFWKWLLLNLNFSLLLHSLMQHNFACYAL